MSAVYPPGERHPLSCSGDPREAVTRAGPEHDVSESDQDRGIDPTPWLWLAVLLEIVSPIPAVLSIGAIWVLLFRPPWLPRLVDRLYSRRT